MAAVTSAPAEGPMQKTRTTLFCMLSRLHAPKVQLQKEAWSCVRQPASCLPAAVHCLQALLLQIRCALPAIRSICMLNIHLQSARL